MLRLAGRSQRFDDPAIRDGALAALADQPVELLAERAKIGDLLVDLRERVGAEGERLLLAVIVVALAPELPAARRHEQEEAIGVGQLIGFGTRLGRADFRITQRRASPKYHDFRPPRP